MTEFVHGRSHTVKLGDSHSHSVYVASGVPQGTVLGPTLFLLFIDDICDIFDELNVKCKLYADNIKLYSCYNVNVPQHDLMIAIGRLHNWSLTWQLQIASDKCFVCTVSNVRHNPGCSSTAYGISNQMFASVVCVQNLGVMIDSKLKFDKHIAGIVH